jgi:predicted transposase/invertase (TIGR01784 family)
MLNRYLNPRNDTVFRKLFGTEDNKDVLIRFLNTILELKDQSLIEDVDFMNPWQAPRIDGAKQSIVDVLVKDKRNVRYIVEMQVCHTADFTKRAQYYTAKTYVDQMKAGHGYRGLNSVFFIAIADHILFPDKAAYKSLHLMCDQSTGENDLEAFRFTFIELPKFKKSLKELSSVEDQWLYFLKHAEEVSDMPATVDDSALQKAYHAIESMGWDERELAAYEDSQLAVYDEQSRRDWAEQQMEKGIQKGLEKGLEKGREEGLKKGADQAKIDIARSMLAKQIPVQVIAECTGLSEHDIASLH